MHRKKIFIKLYLFIRPITEAFVIFIALSALLNKNVDRLILGYLDKLSSMEPSKIHKKITFLTKN